MRKLYFYIIFSLFSLGGLAQETKQTKATDGIEGLNFYPNPVNNGKLYITSKSGLDKDISIYDVLGKLVFQASLTTKELNVSALSSGVYIIKFKENEATATRKLIIR
jgi:Secretion system C-terminal sorting domain